MNLLIDGYIDEWKGGRNWAWFKHLKPLENELILFNPETKENCNSYYSCFLASYKEEWDSSGGEVKVLVDNETR